jgi:hypothetical protein
VSFLRCPSFRSIRLILPLVCLFPWHAHAEKEPKAGSEAQAEISILAGLALRSASKDNNTNPDDIGYGPAPQLAFQARGYVWPWLNAAIYHHRASHELRLPQGAAGFDYQRIDKDKILTYSLGVRLEPTYNLSDEFRLWLSLGIGWGRMKLNKTHVVEANRTYTVPERPGVFIEVPVGFGASYQLIPNWLALQGEMDIAPLSKQSGKLFDHTSFVDSQGSLDLAGPMPTQTLSASFLLGLSLLL